MIRRRPIAGQDGVTLIEVVVTVLVICVGVLATLASFTEFSQAAGSAHQRAVMASIAQREMEQLRPVAYEKLALAASPDATAATQAPLRGVAAAEPVITGGVVRPGPDEFLVDGVRGVVYRYVTLRPQACPALSARVHDDISTALGQPMVDVQAALGDLCPDTEYTKRITVVVVPTGGVRPDRDEGLRVSTVVSDPDAAMPAAVSEVGLRVQQAVGAIDDAGAAVPSVEHSQQPLTLTDTPCDRAGAEAPTDHPTRDTSGPAPACDAGATVKPDLMVPGAPAGDAADPLHDYSNDLARPAAGGLALLRDDRGGACGSAVDHDAAETGRRRSLHTWASPAAAAPFETPVTGGRAALTLWTSTATAVDGAARLCVALRRHSTGEVVGAGELSLPRWPGEATPLTVSFDVAHVTIPAGERLLLTLRVPSDSGSDLRLLYHHAAHVSQLTVPTVGEWQFR